MAIAQFSVAVALITAFSAAALGVGLSLLQNKDFSPLLSPLLRPVFAGSLLLLVAAALLSCGAVITRTLDFRLTARKVRKSTSPGYSSSLTIFWVGPDGYGRATWRLFWASCAALAGGVISLVVCVGNAYAPHLF